MTETINTNAPKRKLLSLNPKRESPGEPKFLPRDESFFMVWCVNGAEPKRIYQPQEIRLALDHAMLLSSQTGKEFHVMRSWRGFRPIDQGAFEHEQPADDDAKPIGFYTKKIVDRALSKAKL